MLFIMRCFVCREGTGIDMCIKNFTAAILEYFTAVLIICMPQFVLNFIKASPTVSEEGIVWLIEEGAVLLYLMGFLSGTICLLNAFSWSKYYILSENGIAICIFGFQYRYVHWGEVFDIMIGPDPFIRRGRDTVLLNCQAGCVYRPQDPGAGSAYEKNFYRDLYRGRIIRFPCCGKRLDAVVALLKKYFDGEIWR